MQAQNLPQMVPILKAAAQQTSVNNNSKEQQTVVLSNDLSYKNRQCTISAKTMNYSPIVCVGAGLVPARYVSGMMEIENGKTEDEIQGNHRGIAPTKK